MYPVVKQDREGSWDTTFFVEPTTANVVTPGTVYFLISKSHRTTEENSPLDIIYNFSPLPHYHSNSDGSWWRRTWA
jgi:hypothetical protein